MFALPDEGVRTPPLEERAPGIHDWCGETSARVVGPGLCCSLHAHFRERLLLRALVARARKRGPEPLRRACLRSRPDVRRAEEAGCIGCVPSRVG